MEIIAKIVEKSKISHELKIEKEGKEYSLILYGFSKFRLLDEEGQRWDSAEIDFKDKLRFSVNIFDRLISCFSFDLNILKYLIKEGKILEEFINTALKDIDMTINTFRIKEVPISRGSMKLRAYLDFDKLNVCSCIILCSPEYKNIIVRHNVKKKVSYMKAIASKNKVHPIMEKTLRSIEKEFKYSISPMNPVSVEEFLKAYLKQ